MPCPPKNAWISYEQFAKNLKGVFCFGGSDHVSPRRFRPAQAASTDPTGSVETPRGARSRGAGAEGENRAKAQGSQGQEGFRCFFGGGQFIVGSDVFIYKT